MLGARNKSRVFLFLQLLSKTNRIMPARHKADNRAPSSRSKPDLVQQIQMCKNDSSCKRLGEIIRQNGDIFYDDDATDILIDTIYVMKYEMLHKDISSLMNIFSKLQVPSSSSDLL
jgi:hypothetical protein